MTEHAGPSPIEPGMLVDHFKIVRSIGRGGMGEVYLARDTVLGRKVAIKVIREGALGGRTAVRRFLAEARATASFSHPHIVTLFATGEVRGQPYVALEFVEGQTLAQRLRDGALGTMDAVRIIAAVADAVREAHRHGVVHRDLKPDNVIIGRDGRPRVLDFGLARTVKDRSEGGDGAERGTDAIPESARDLAATLVGPSGPFDSARVTLGPGELAAAPDRDTAADDDGVLCGTPLYMAPEQWCGHGASRASDVWAIGVMLHELVEGEHPLQALGMFQIAAEVLSRRPMPSPVRPVPQALLELLEACTKKDPRDRPTIAEVCGRLDQLLTGTRRSEGDEVGPFRGLLAFDERHADRFFGREVEVESFVERLREQSIVAVVSHSGAGKSSFVQAGVIPRLREQRRCVVLRMRPGHAPVRALAQCLASSESASTRALSPTRPHTSKRVSSTDAPSETDRQELEAALRRSPERTALFLADLADRENALTLLFVDQLEELFTLGASPSERDLFLRTLACAADDPVVPVRVCYTLRDDFVGQVARSADARTLLAGLFVLQTPGRERLQEILERALKASGYTWESPSLVDEMARSVESEPAALPLLQFAGQMMWERRDRERRILTTGSYTSIGGVAGALARHAEAVLAGMTHANVRVARTLMLRLVTPQRTRRMMDQADLLEGLGDEARGVLKDLVDARLLIARVRAGDREHGQVEIAHEALIAQWQRLSRWVDEAHEEIVFLHEVEQAATLWQKRGRPEEEVWRGDALQDACRRAERLTRDLPPTARDFLAAGRALQARASHRKRLAVALSLALLSVVAVVLAWQNREARLRRADAEQARELAEAKRAEALYEGARAALDRLDPLEASAKLRSALELHDVRLARPLWWQLRGTPMRWTAEVTAATNLVAASPDGSFVAVGGNDGTVFRIDVNDGSVGVFRGIRGQISQVFFAPAGTLRVATWGGELFAWDLGAHALSTVMDPVPGALQFAQSARGTWLVPVRQDGSLRLFDGRTHGEKWRRDEDPNPMSAVVFTGDERRVIVGRESGAIRIHDSATGTLERVLREQGARVAALQLGPSGSQLWSLDSAGELLAWDLTSSKADSVGKVSLGGMVKAAFNGDGTLLAHAGTDKEIRVVKTTNLEEVCVLRGHRDTPYSMAFLPSSRFLVSSSTAKDVILWDLDRVPTLPIEPRGHSAEIHGLAMSPDGTKVVTGGTDSSLRWWDAETGLLRRVLGTHGGRINSVAFSADGRWVVSGAIDGTVRVWDEAAGVTVKTIEVQSPPMCVTFLDGSKTVASAHGDGTVRVWDRETGTVQRTIKVGVRLWDMEADRAGRLAVTGSDGAVRLFEPSTGRVLRTLRGHTSDVWGVSWGPDGSLLSAGEDGKLVLWPGADAPSRILVQHDGRLTRGTFSPDGGTAVVTGSGGLAFLLDLRTQARIALRGHRHRDVNTALFDPNTASVVTVGDDATVRRWRVSDGEPLWSAPLLVPRPPFLITHRGRIALDPAAAPPPQSRWLAHAEREATLAAMSRDSATLCLRARGGDLEMWDTARDERRLQTRVGRDVTGLEAARESCWARTSDGGAWLLHPAEDNKPVAQGVTALAPAGEDMLVGQNGTVRVFDAAGIAIASFTADVGITAVGKVGDWIAIGYREGGLELISRTAPDTRRTAFQQLPMSAVERIVEGPMGTLVAGYSSGIVGTWDTETGIRLSQFGIHGPAVHLHVEGTRLYAASELGDHAVADLPELAMDHCSLLRAVWESVPVVWRDGRAVLSPVPSGHACSGR